jgi:hypothetical protein
MSAPDPGWPGHIGDAFATLAVTICVALWRFVTSKASKEELAAAVREQKEQNAAMLERIDDHYEEARESRERLYDKVDEFAKDFNKGLGATMVSLSRLQGQLDRDDERRGN